MSKVEGEDMKFKTKYNIGDIVVFEKQDFSRDIGKIMGVDLFFSYETMLEIKYIVEKFFKDATITSSSIEIKGNSIIKKLNRKAFEKAYAEKWASIAGEK